MIIIRFKQITKYQVNIDVDEITQARSQKIKATIIYTPLLTLKVSQLLQCIVFCCAGRS